METAETQQSPGTSASPSRPRVAWIDTARGLGMVLVFYGHVINPLLYRDDGVAFQQFKLLYAFHMPFFFLLAGYLSRIPDRAGPYLLSRLRTRLVPAYFFCFVGIGIELVLGRGFGLPWFGLVIGVPVGNPLTWFLFCLFSVELYHLLLGRFEGRLAWELVWLPLLFAAGTLAANDSEAWCEAIGLRRVPLYLGEGVMAYALYRTGRVMRRLAWPRDDGASGRAVRSPALLALAALAVLLVTFPLNRGAFTWLVPVVMMSASSHGHTVLFVVSALAGSLMLFHAAVALPKLRFLTYIGQNTIVLLGLDGILHAFINKRLAPLLPESITGSHAMLLLTAGALTLLSLAVCVPFVELLDRFAPWVTGKTAHRR